MTSEYSKKSVLVTGGARGIGSAIARTLAAQGWRVAVADIRGNAPFLFVRCDVSREADVRSAVRKVLRRFGRLDALVNNAGTVGKQMRVESMDAARLTRVFAVNAIGAFLCAREAVRRMSTKHGGRGGAIVNVSSAAARLGSAGEYVDYAATKGALDSLTIGLAREVAEEGIRVNGVRPGYIYTDFHALGGEPGRVERVKQFVPLKRGGRPEEIANAILWLLSDEASFTTGGFIDAAGGR